MDKRAVFLGFISMLALVSCLHRSEGPCFSFPGSGYLEFSPNNYDNDNYAYYRLKFRTNKYDGVILYSRGLTGDFESLYIRNGHLHYIVVNASSRGVEGCFQGYFRSEEVVNNYDWVTVNLYRFWRTRLPGRRQDVFRTGFTVKVGYDGNLTSYFTENTRREGVSLSSTVYIGGYRWPLNNELGNFEGHIKDIQEMKNRFVFREPSFNFNRMVERYCLYLNDIV